MSKKTFSKIKVGDYIYSLIPEGNYKYTYPNGEKMPIIKCHKVGRVSKTKQNGKKVIKITTNSNFGTLFNTFECEQEVDYFEMGNRSVTVTVPSIYRFFTDIQGAKSYYIRTVLNDYNHDKLSKEIEIVSEAFENLKEDVDLAIKKKISDYLGELFDKSEEILEKVDTIEFMVIDMDADS